jgi:hypothetical protein
MTLPKSDPIYDSSFFIKGKPKDILLEKKLLDLKNLIDSLGETCQLPEGWEYVENNQVVGPDGQEVYIENGKLKASNNTPVEIKNILRLRDKINVILEEFEHIAYKVRGSK